MAPVALAAAVVLGRAARVVLVLQASAAPVAVVARAAPGSMQVVSLMAPLVVMPAKVAPVVWAELQAHRAPTRRLL